MKTLIVDASVAAKWFLPEEGSEEALTLLDGKRRLLAPDLLWIEVASILWKLVQRTALEPIEAESMLADAFAFPVETVEADPLLPQGLTLALETKRTVYDSLYLALAIREKATLITADQRFIDALEKTPHTKRIRSLSRLR